jgi:hypothetical protein
MPQISTASAISWSSAVSSVRRQFSGIRDPDRAAERTSDLERRTSVVTLVRSKRRAREGARRSADELKGPFPSVGNGPLHNSSPR